MFGGNMEYANGIPPKYRPQQFATNFYHPRVRPDNYAMTTCNRRQAHDFWHQDPKATIERKSRGKVCSAVLAIISFLVLISVLAIAGMALYMGALRTETPTSNINVSDLLSYSVSAKIVRGDRFAGALQEKARRYRMQLETLYQRSILGPSLVSCNVEKFSNDTQMIFLKLILNRSKLPRNAAITTEKTIRDVLLTDAISRKPVLRSLRFDAKSITIKQIINEPESNKPSKSKNNFVLKATNSRNPTTAPSIKKNAPLRPVEAVKNSSVIQGSFTISKTDADITEKREQEPKVKQIVSTTSRRPSTLKDTSVTSALYKIAAIEKINKTQTTQTSTVTTPVTGPKTTVTMPKVLTTQENPLFVVNSNLFNQEPWIPIVSENRDVAPPTTPLEFTTESFEKNKSPVYSSFTNPGLSYYALNAETLGSTSLKSHPIPVNKIPKTTEPSNFKVGQSFIPVETIKHTRISPLERDKSSTVLKTRQEQELKNLSAIFHDLASNFQAVNLTQGKSEEQINQTFNKDVILGEGHVEVVEADEETLLMQTTKFPLVTLIPGKSNSGIGRPLRKRPFDANDTDLSVENRSFPGSTHFNNLADKKQKVFKTEVVTSISSEISRIRIDKKPPNKVPNYHIMGVLNFATETTNFDTRSPKMDPVTLNQTKSEVAVYATNSSITTNRDLNKQNRTFILSPDQLKQLSAISHIHNNVTLDEDPVSISTKAISPSYTINHSGFKILTKTFNKIRDLSKDGKEANYKSPAIGNRSSECGNFTIKCGDGKCLPETTKCNKLIDCNDGKDEQDCNCADYLRSQFLLRKICDGVVDCWDYSDENQCEWCKPQQYVCGSSKVCIDRNKICDGFRDCPHGDDERQCVTIAESAQAADESPYSSVGYLMVQKYGAWGKLCVENFKNATNSHISWPISDLGKTVCKSMTYQSLDTITSLAEPDTAPQSRYFELSQNTTEIGFTFSETACKSRRIVTVRCRSLECGARPQVTKHIARIVGGGNAGLGAWPWQAALYKEGEFQCGATLLSELWLISAGHCFYHSQEEHWVARLGALRRGAVLPSPYEQLRTIVKIAVHPGYVDSGFINDISILKMHEAVVFSDYVRPICLPRPEEAPIDGRLCTVVGWGQLFEVGRIFPDTLQEVQVPIISTAECQKRTIFLPLYKITDDMFCAGYDRGGRDACLGDSGGPLMCPEFDGRYVLQGVTSNGYGCARANRPGVYTKVANYVPWITGHMEKNDNYTTNSKSVCLGHRCPLGECLPKSRLCNGYIECSDGSDESDC